LTIWSLLLLLDNHLCHQEIVLIGFQRKEIVLTILTEGVAEDQGHLEVIWMMFLDTETEEMIAAPGLPSMTFTIRAPNEAHLRL